MDTAVEALAGSGNRSTRCVDCFCVAYNIDFLFAIVSHILQYPSDKHDEREAVKGWACATWARHQPQAMVVTAHTETLWNATYFLGGRIPGITSQLCCGIDKTEPTNPPNKIHSGSREYRSHQL